MSSKNAAGVATARALIGIVVACIATLALGVSSASAAPANDSFAAPEVLDPAPPIQLGGDNTGATKESGELDHAGDPGGHSVWYSWTPAHPGQVRITVASCGSGFDPVLAVYTGTDVADLTTIASDDDAEQGCHPGDSEVEFGAVAGLEYHIAVDGHGGSEGEFALGIEGAPANDNLAGAQALPTDPPAQVEGDNSLAGRQGNQEPEHAGNPGGHSVWFKWTPSVSGPAKLDTCSFQAFDSLLAVYTGTELGNLVEVTSNDFGASAGCQFGGSEVEFDAAAGTTYLIAVDGSDGATGRFLLRLHATPANDDFAAAEALQPALLASADGTTTLATKENKEPNHAGDPGGHSVWYSWTPEASGPVSLSTCSFAESDSLLAVYTGTSFANLVQVAANDDAESTLCAPGDSEVELDAVEGTTYMIAVDSAAETSGDFELRVAPRAANDLLNDAETLPPFLPVFEVGSNRHATKEAGELNHAGDPGGHSVWYSWTPSKDVTVDLSATTCGFNADELDPLLAVYTGVAGFAPLSPVASNDDAPDAESCAPGESGLEFEATEGTTYFIAVDGKGGSQGLFELDLESHPSNDAFAGALPLQPSLPDSIDSSTRHAGKEPGEPNHAGSSGGHSVWYSWTPETSGQVSASVCPTGDGEPLLAVYTGSTLADLMPVAGSSSSPVCAGGARTTFNAVAETTYRIAVDARGGTPGRFQLRLRGTPGNDAFASAEAVPTNGFSQLSNELATKQTGELNHAGDPGGHSVWFRWKPARSGRFVISTCFSHLDTVLALYTGAQVDNLTPVASNDDAKGGGCGKGSSRVEVNASATTIYKIAVDGKGGGEGSFQLHVERQVGNDGFAGARALNANLPVVVEDDNDIATKELGELNHAGDPGGHSVWFRWKPARSGPVVVRASSCRPDPVDTLLAVYTGAELDKLTEVASNDNDDSGTSCRPGDSRLEFNAVAGTTYMIAVDGKAGSHGRFQLAIDGVPGNDTVARASSLGGGAEASFSGSNRFATKQTGEPNHAGNPGGHSVWFRWTAPHDGTFSVSTCGSAFDTLLAVYTGTDPAGLTPLASNDDGSGSCSPQSKLRLSASAGTTYRIAVDGKGGAQGDFELNVRAQPSNDSFAHPVAVGPAPPFFVPGSTFLATKQTGEPNHAGNPGGDSVWFSWTPRVSGRLVLRTCGVGRFDSVLSVYTGTSVGGLTPVASNDDANELFCEPGDSRVAFAATAGTTYRIAVDGKGGDEGSFFLEGLVATQPLLSVSKGGSGAGTVASAPAGIDCGATCEAEFGTGAAVTLTAAPLPGSTFAGWSGAGCSGTGPCQVTMNSDLAVHAEFTAQPKEEAHKPKPKPLRCRRGFQKKKVHGKLRCVKKPKPRKKHRRRHR